MHMTLLCMRHLLFFSLAGRSLLYTYTVFIRSCWPKEAFRTCCTNAYTLQLSPVPVNIASWLKYIFTRLPYCLIHTSAPVLCDAATYHQTCTAAEPILWDNSSHYVQFVTNKLVNACSFHLTHVQSRFAESLSSIRVTKRMSTVRTTRHSKKTK